MFALFVKIISTITLTDKLNNDFKLKHPDCFVIGCLRAVTHAFDENFACLDLMNRIDVMSGSAMPLEHPEPTRMALSLENGTTVYRTLFYLFRFILLTQPLPLYSSSILRNCIFQLSPQ